MVMEDDSETIHQEYSSLHDLLLDEVDLNTVDEPRDVGKIVYIAFFLNALGALLPWNMFITIAPQYYVTYWFSPNGTSTEYSEHFMSALGIAAQVPNLSVNVANVFLVIGGSLLLRLLGPLILNCVNIFIVLLLIAFVDPSVEAMGWFYAVTLAIVAVLNASNGFYNNSICGLASGFPPSYINAGLLGSGLCGIFTSLLNIAFTEIFDIPQTIALIYFSISLATLVACAVSLVIATRKPFFKFHHENGERARVEQGTEKPTVGQYTECFKICWLQLFCLFFTFFVTLSIFPAVAVNIPISKMSGEGWNFFISEKQYVNVTTFLNFNIFAFIGSIVAEFVQVPSKRFLWIPVVARTLFIPLFVFLNYIPEARTLPVLFESPWIFIPSVSLLAFTHGYFFSLGMMNVPKVVDDSLKMIAGKFSGMFLTLGITYGCAFVVVIKTITTSF